MIKNLSFLLFFLVISCASEPEKRKKKEIQYNEASLESFFKILQVEYKQNSEYFNKQGFKKEGKLFDKKAISAKRNDATIFTNTSFPVSEEKSDEIELAYLFIEKLRSNKTIFDLFPESLARMQASYDCMVVEYALQEDGEIIENQCEKKFDAMQKSFQRTGFSKNIKYLEEEEIRETFIIYFALNSDVIEPDYFDVLNNIAKKVEGFKKYKLRILGLADKTGTKDINIDISKRRSEIVKKALVRMGVPAKNIETEFLADDFSLIDTKNPEKFNRRVLIDLIQ